MSKILVNIIVIILVGFSACKKSSNTVVPIDYSYFPQVQKSWIIYNVTQINIDKKVNKNDTLKYQLKEIIDTVFDDNIGHPTYRIERYTRNDTNPSWQIQDVWYQGIVDNAAYKVEENVKYLKLRFPVVLNKSWNGNLYNTEDPLDYKITSIDKQDTVNGIQFDKVLTVTQQDKLDAIEKYYFIEKYAKNIGLIQKNMISIDSFTYMSDTEPAENRIKLGTLYYINIVTYGGFPSK